MSYLKQFSTRHTPQSEPLPGQVPNSAGGHAWAVDDWMRLRRFLILGSEGGSYYASERQLTRENAQAVMRCVETDGAHAVNEICAVSLEGRAPKNDPAIFALALAASASSDATRAYALERLGDVCRIGTHLFTFAGYVEQFRGWGRGLRTAVGRWYDRPDLAYQLVKYRQRGGWTHRDMLRLAHPSPSPLLAWAAGKPTEDPLPLLIDAFERAQHATSPQETVAVIESCPDLPREALNPDHLTSPLVWEALLNAGMPMTALIRNLATMTRVGLLTPMSIASRTVCEQIGDSERLRKARVHPLAVLVALKTYESGHSARGDGMWSPVAQIVDALDGAFYEAFGNVEPSRKRTLLALDVSGSMDWSSIAGMPGITPRVGSAAMALVTAAVEPDYCILPFSDQLMPVALSPRMRLDQVIAGLSQIRMGGTDCSLPMLWALANHVSVDTFVVYTDSETWAGRVHPSQTLTQYRQRTGIDARLVVVGMISNGFSIADPNDRGMLDVVGFDTATPQVIGEFSAG
jgi:60 kDa SS-A/Ro ribonucleoprotein